jgi:hypothetical protein
LNGRGELGEIIANFDWSSTSLGGIAAWIDPCNNALLGRFD